jgi:hypothetical protein
MDRKIVVARKVKRLQEEIRRFSAATSSVLW